MGLVKHLLIETKVFVLSLEGRKYIGIIERSRKLFKRMIFRHGNAHWLAITVEVCASSVERKNFGRTYWDGNHIASSLLIECFQALPKSNWIWWQRVSWCSSDSRRNGREGLEIPLNGNEEYFVYARSGNKEYGISSMFGWNSRQGKGEGEKRKILRRGCMGKVRKCVEVLGGSN